MLNYSQISAPSTIFSFKFALIYAISIALLVVSSKLQVPMFPVPITFQTAAILLIPALFGMALSISVIASWLALGALGLPVFAGAIGAPGLGYFIGPTGGYFVGFILATFLTAFAIHKVQIKNIWALFALFMGMHALILFTGWIWLGYGLPQLGAEKAWLTGVFPFLTGSVLKSALVVALVYPALKK